MTKPIFVYDPTHRDPLSKVRGVGRYVQILREQFETRFKFTSDLSIISGDSILINPFFNFLAQPYITGKVADKQIAVIHDLIPLKYPSHFPVGLKGKFTIYRNRQLLKNYDVFITDSEASKKDIINMLKIDPGKIQVIYPPLSEIFYKKNDAKIPEGIPEKYCIYVGDATWNKNLVNIAKAIQEINVTCVFVGKVFKKTGDLDHPWQKELKNFLELTKDDKRFIFPGFVSDEELVALYKGARCNILVSRDEGFGFSFVEAASAGTPSILSNIDVLKETAQDSALFADPENPTNIANQIGELYFNENTRKLYSTKALNRSEFFSRKKFTEAFENLWT